MRVLVFFDLPVYSSEEQRAYRAFHRMLIKNGFVMMQESVYSKIALNHTAVAAIKEVVRKHKPSKGLIQLLAVTEKQFESMEYILGEGKTSVVDTPDRMVIL